MKKQLLFTLSLLSLSTFNAQAQTFVQRTGEDNPYDAINVYASSAPVLVNFDGDDDLDLLVGDGGGKFLYYRNDGSSFTSLKGTDTESPFFWLDPGTTTKPSFVDVDGDMDLDLVAGEGYSGTIHYYQNNDGLFTEVTGDDDPFSSINVGGNAAPTFVDVDGDKDLDLVVGNDDGDFFYFQNNEGVYTEKTGTDNPFSTLNNDGNSAPVFIDIDGDKDLDLVSGDFWDGKFILYQNNEGVYTEKMGTDNPLDGLSNGGYASIPTFGDVDGDGDMDLVSGENGGKIYYFENTTPVLGTNEFTSSNSEFSVYPNPARDVLHVEEDEYKIKDMLGNTVYNTSIKTKVIDISTLKSGQYLLQSTENNSLFIKL